MRRKRLSEEAYIEGILEGNKVILSRAITLVESTLREDNELGAAVLEQLLPYTGKSLRLGITGVPGVGKSTFIEALGRCITSEGSKLAVLAIDPSSQRSGGSILGDKTRMESLAHDPLAYIRPTATGDALGGVAHKTREAMLLCEAAGYEVIFVETVGVGQSEVAVKGMVDFFLLLMLAGAGDELQGIKKGIMEMADAIAITKVDGDNRLQAKKARATYENALHLFPLGASGWNPKVLTCSSQEQEGIHEIWQLILAHKEHMLQRGLWKKNRQQQNVEWMHKSITQLLRVHFYENETLRDQLREKEKVVEQGQALPLKTARELVKGYFDQMG